MIKLSKFALEQNYSLSELITFLNQNGYNKKEDASELISKGEIEFVKNNFNSFLRQKDDGYENYKKNFFSRVKNEQKIETPVQLKVIEAANKEKLLIERIIGFTDFQWEYLIAKYKGVVSQPVPFTVFDEVICDLLLVEDLSKKEIGNILGLNIVDDPAENGIVDKSLKSLREEEMIDGYDDKLYLTETGNEYARNGVKYSYFSRDFSIYFDITGRNEINPKNELRKLKSEKVTELVEEVNVSLDQIKNFAVHQAPEVHFPDKNYILQSADLVKAERFKAKVWVIFLENFRNSTLRVLVYDESQDKIVEQLSADLNKREDKKKELFERLILTSEELEITDEEKPAKQIEEEKKLIEKQTLIDNAIQAKDVKKAELLKAEIKKEKRDFNSVEFELELKEIFEKNNDELWFVSPWIKYHAIKYRINYFEKQLQQAAKLFIVYSMPSKEEVQMEDPRAMAMLANLERKYNNFYIHQLPIFHYKHVFVKNKNLGNLYYSGSFNVLSFYVDKNRKNIVQEEMNKLDWSDASEKKYISFLEEFGKKYIKREVEAFNALQQLVPQSITREFLNKIKTIDNIKLHPFKGVGFENFDSVLQVLETKKAEALNLFGRKVFITEIDQLRSNIEKLENVKINKTTKKEYVEKFENLTEEFDYLTDEFSEDLTSLFKKINRLKTIH